MDSTIRRNYSLEPAEPSSDTTNQDLISDDFTNAFNLASHVFIKAIIGVPGIGANIINILVFVKLGLNDTVNITLLGLSVSDLWYLIAMIWTSILHNPLWKYAQVNFDAGDLHNLTGGWPMFYFSRVSNSITGYLIFTRCLCIVLPLKVKDMITPKRTSIVIVTIYIGMAVTVAPPYFAASYNFIFNPSKNRTILQLVFKDNREELDSMTTSITVVLTILTFVWVIVCTIILVTNLQRKSKWREKTAGGSNSEALSSRDQHVIKMVIALVVIFIVSFSPATCTQIAMTVEPTFKYGALHSNLFMFIIGICDITVAINASVNIIVYMNMSSKYRETFMLLFRRANLPVIK